MSMRRHLIVLDLDETLLHATSVKFSHEPDFIVGAYYIYLRLGLSEFLAYADRHFDLGVWSSSSQSYVDAVTSQIFGNRIALQFAWSAEKCIQKPDVKTNGYIYIKDLRRLQKLGYSVDQVWIIDDSPEKVQRQPGRHIRIAPFTGASDNELSRMISVLEKILNAHECPKSLSNL